MKNKCAFSIICIMILLSSLWSAQEKLPEIEVICLSDHLYKLQIGPVSVVASIGPDGVLLSDTGFESTAMLLKSNLEKLGGHHIRYIINTHWHSDHCSGNKVLGKEAVDIIAHENVLKTLSEDQTLTVFWKEKHKSLPEYARPNLVFSHRLTVYFNNEQIEIIHFPNGHTNGDAIVYFKKANVVHMGDLLFSNGFPAIDFEHGGNAEQWAKNLQEIIDMMPEDVKLIAGHGPDYTLEKLNKYREMILSTAAIVKKEISKGKSLDEMKKDKILTGWEEWAKGFHSCNDWIEIVYHSLTFVKSRDNRLQKYLRLSARAYQSKDYSEYHRLMSKIVELEPQNYRHCYNLACACALNGDVKNTVKILRRLLSEDYDLAILAETDSDYDPIRNTAPFQEIIKGIKEKTQPLNNSHIAFSIPEKDLIPEGIAYDPVDEAFYLGSVQKCKIIKIDKHGKISDFTEPRQDGLVPVLGMRIDSKRRFLWAVSSYGFYKAGIPRDLLGTTGVFKYDLQRRKLIKKYMLPQKENHMLNDLTIGSNGDVYVTDWRVPAIYLISSDKDTIEKFYDLPRRPNGIDFSDDGTKLFIGGAGIGVLDIATKTFKELKHPVNMYLSGDGLYYFQNSLIAVQNGGLRKITRFYLNEAQDEVVRSQALEAYHSLFNLPTTGVITGKHFYYIANSQLRAYDKDGNLFPLNKLEETKILKIEMVMSKVL